MWKAIPEEPWPSKPVASLCETCITVIIKSFLRQTDRQIVVKVQSQLCILKNEQRLYQFTKLQP